MEKVRKSGSEIMDEVMCATVNLDSLAAVTSLLIGNFDLEKSEFTEFEKMYLGEHHKMLFDTLFLLQTQLKRMSEQINNISMTKDSANQ